MSLTFRDIPEGSSVFLDANVFIYAFGRDPGFGKPCADILEQIDLGKIVGIASVQILSDVAYRLMTLEAYESFGWPYLGIGKRLRRHPEKICELSRFRGALNAIASGKTQIIPVTTKSVLDAATCSIRHGLLSNDALIVAVMESQGLNQLASSDSDFDRVPGVIRYSPV